MSTDPRVDAYIANAAPFARPILEHLRKVVHTGCPGVQETMKWSFPHFDYHGMFCSMAAFKAHVTFGFWKAKLLADQLPKTTTRAMGQFGRIGSLADLPSERALVALVRKAAALNERGVKVPAKARPAARPAPRTPKDLAAALRSSARAAAAFKALSPSHRREYIEWIEDARRPATRERRLAQAVAWIAEGKSRNWKYERRSAD